MNIEQERQQAQNENTVPEILVKLAKSEDNLTRKYVAVNPNTPTATLSILGDEFPDEITANPIFNLLLLENSESKFAQLSLARSSTTSEDILNKLINHKDRDIREAVAKNKNVTLSMLKELIAHNNQHFNVLQAVVRNAKASTELIDKMFNQHLHNFPIESALKNAKTSDITLEKIVIERGLSNQNMLQLIREHPNVSQTTIQTFQFIIGGLDTHTPIHILKKLANHQGYWIRNLVARYPSTPIKLLNKLILDSDIKVRKSVAANPNISVELLNKLSSGSDRELRTIVAAHPKISQAALNKLIKDVFHHVRAAIATREDISEEISSILAQDSSNYVRQQLAFNPNIPIEIIELLSKDSEALVQMKVAQNINTSPEILTRLASSSRAGIRRGVAGNSQTPLSILDKLKTDKDKYVRAKVAENTNISLERLGIPVNKLGKSIMNITITGEDNYLVRAAIAQRKDIPENVASILAKDNVFQVRNNLANNPYVSLKVIINLLTKDSNHNVRWRAREMYRYHYQKEENSETKLLMKKAVDFSAPI